MNRRLAPAPDAAGFSFEYNGEPVAAAPGDTVASALLAAGIDVFSRSIKYHRPRGPWCLSARCSHCLVRVDGVPDVIACATPAAPGMRVSAQNAYPSAKHDVLAAIDWLFPKGLDHHSMFAGVPVFEGAMAKVARHIAGLGPIPDKAHPSGEPAVRREIDLAIVGAGPAGLACARALVAAGLRVEVFDDQALVGGRLLSGLEANADEELAWAERTRAELEAGGVAVNTRSWVLATYVEEGRPLLAVRRANPDRLELVGASRVAYCTGAAEPLLPFTSNDLPGVYSGRGLARLIRLQKVLPGRRAVVVGGGPEAAALAGLLRTCGAAVEAIVAPLPVAGPEGVRVLTGYSPTTAHGHRRVQGLTVVDAAGTEQTLDCDLIVLCPPPAAAFELPRQAGAAVAFRAEAGGYVIEAERDGRTRAPAVFAAGDVTGPTALRLAREAGDALGRALAAPASR